MSLVLQVRDALHGVDSFQPAEYCALGFSPNVSFAPPSQVPEPPLLALLAVGLAGILLHHRRA